MIFQCRHENATGVPDVDATIGGTCRNMTAVGVESDAREIAADLIIIVTESRKDLIVAQVDDFDRVIANAGGQVVTIWNENGFLW
jgi:hypothetical protein